MNDRAQSAVKLALQTRRLRTTTAGIELLQSEPIAVVGLGCRVPEGEGPEGFWRMLLNGVDAIREVPPERWDIDAFYDPDPSVPGKMTTRWGGFLSAIDTFDARFFGIAPREAATMDPQHRLLLEVAWEALEDAGLDVDLLAGSATGVFAAVYNGDYGREQLKVLDAIDAYTSSGTAHSIASGRISFLFDFRGPSVTVDTACSASLTAVHLACQSLRAGDSDLALAGGASLVLAPEPAVSMSKWGMMAKDGRCKTFDARADGFVRGEGCGVVVLKRLSDALADGDRVRAVIRGTAVNQDGRSANLTAPNGLAQQAVVRLALENGRIAPREISYVEAHGTGTALGDPIEVEALSEVLGRAEHGPRPCALASVKTNIGHLEAAAGIAGLMKVVLALEHGVIPPHLHFHTPNPHLSLEGTRFYVPTEARSWTSEEGPRFAGVSSFGFGGTNAHVVLEEAPRLPERSAASAPARTQLLPLSAQSPVALQALAQRYADLLSSLGPGSLAFADVCASAAHRRTHLEHRLTAVSDDGPALASKLAAFAGGERPAGLATGVRSRGRLPKVVFVFSGQGPQWWAMGRQLEAEEPSFRETLARCDAEMRRHASWSLLAELHAEESASRLSQTEIAQPALFALQVALAALWRSWGIEPFALVGHSVGEVAAAHVSGALSFEAAARLVVLRGRVMQQGTGLGKMASVELPVAEVESLLTAFPTDLDVAAVNGPRSCVVSGAREALQSFLAALTERGVATRLLPVDYAFHSPQMEPFSAELEAALEGLEVGEPSLLLVSATTGQRVARGELDGAYWGRNLRRRVLFADAIQNLLEAEGDAFLEIGPHPVLSHSVLAVAEARGRDVPVLASLRRGQDERAGMLQALGSLYSRGSSVRWSALLSGAERFVTLPSYPWQRERYWFDRAGPAAAARPSPATLGHDTGRALLGVRLRSPLPEAQFDAQWSLSRLAFVEDHRILGSLVVPATAFVASLLAAASEVWGAGTHVLEDLQVELPLVLGPEVSVVQIVMDTPEEDVSTVSLSSLVPDGDGKQWIRHATGKLRAGSGVDLESRRPPLPADWRPRLAEAEGGVLYQRLRERGVDLGARFQRVRQIWYGKGEAVAHIDGSPQAGDGRDEDGFPPALLDACLQPFAAAVQDLAEESDTLLLPIGVARVRLQAPPEASLWAQVVVRNPVGVATEVVTGDVFVWNEAGAPVAELEGVQLKRTDREAFARIVVPSRRDILYELGWKATGAVPPVGSPGLFLLLADRGGVGQRLAASLALLGHRSIIALPGGSFRKTGADRYELDPLNPGHLKQWLGALVRDEGALRSAVLLLGLDETLDDAASTEAVRDAERRLCGAALHLTQAVAALGAPPSPRLTFVTRGAQAMGARPVDVAFAQTPLWALRNVIALEHADLRPSCIDLDPVPHPGEAEALAAEIAGSSDEAQVALRAGTRYVARLARSRPAGSGHRARSVAEPRQLESSAPGLLDSLALRPHRRTPPGPGQVEIQTRAAGINFRDVLRALGTYPGAPGPLGDECAGVVTAVGEGARRFKVGDEVFGIAPGAFATFILASDALLLAKPPELGFAEAASIPSVFGTAQFALGRVAGMKVGDRVLIHAAAGGVGLAAVALALASGAEVFATAGSPEKRDYLRGLGVAHVMDSRSLAFLDEVLQATGGQGVDIVLNSLAGEFIPRSLAALRRGGCFLELGRTGVWTTALVDGLGREIRYHPIFFADVCVESPDLVRAMLEDLCARFRDGRLRLPPIRSFTLDDAALAFRFMAQARHIGKLVLTLEAPDAVSPFTVRDDRSYLITGGLGGLGLEVARALVQQGARQLVLVGRSAPAESVQAVLDGMRDRGVAVRVAHFDVGNLAEVKAAFRRLVEEGPPLGGIVHAAGVLDDGLLVDQDLGRLERVLAPKVEGAWNLHQATLGAPLDFFVCFSSAASLLGSAGQSSYAAANGFLDGLAHHRRAHGLPALSINWGPWAEVGMAAGLGPRDRSRMSERGFSSFSPAEGARLFLDLVGTKQVQVAALRVDWRRYAQGDPSGSAGTLLADLLGTSPSSTTSARPGPAAEASLLRRLEATPPARHHAVLVQGLHDLATGVLGLDRAASIDPTRPLKELGLDSLMAVELRNAVAARAGRPLPATLLYEHPTLDALADHLLGLFGFGEAEAPAAHPSDRHGQRAAGVTEVRSLSEEEAEALLVKELDSLGQANQNG